MVSRYPSASSDFIRSAARDIRSSGRPRRKKHVKRPPDKQRLRPSKMLSVRSKKKRTGRRQNV